MINLLSTKRLALHFSPSDQYFQMVGIMVDLLVVLILSCLVGLSSGTEDRAAESLEVELSGAPVSNFCTFKILFV